MGIELKTGVRVGEDVSLADLRSEFDAVLVATGARDVPRFDTPGAELGGVYDGYKFLEDVFGQGVRAYLDHPTYSLGRRVLVVGGGNSALDCARTALRLTRGEVTIVYRRTEAEMPVDRVLVEEGKEEGVQLRFLLSPASYSGSGGRVVRATMTVMKLGDVDASGRRSPVPTDETTDLECDSVLIAIGRGPNTFLPKQAGLSLGRRANIAVDEHAMTSVPGVFAAGDVVTGESLVVRAMAKGREAAQWVHGYLTHPTGHRSLYDYYFSRRTTGRYYQGMLEGKEESLPPV